MAIHQEIEDMRKVEEEWKIREHGIIYGRCMDYEPWRICAMTIIKMKLSEFIVNANNFTGVADEYIEDMLRISEKVDGSYEQVMRLNSIIWNEFEDGLFLPESDIKWTPKIMYKNTMQRTFELILWMVISNTIKIGMKIRMYIEILSNLRKYRCYSTQKKEEVEEKDRKVKYLRGKYNRDKGRLIEINTHLKKRINMKDK